MSQELFITEFYDLYLARNRIATLPDLAMKEELEHAFSIASGWENSNLVGEKADCLYRPFPFPLRRLISKSLFWRIKSVSHGAGTGIGEDKVQPDIKAKGQKRA